MRSKTKTMTYPRKTIILLAFLAGALLLSYVVLAVTMVKNQYEIKDLRGQLTEAEQKNRQLHIRASEVASLDRVLERSGDLSYIEIKNTTYIEKPGDSPFAAR